MLRLSSPLSALLWSTKTHFVTSEPGPGHTVVNKTDTALPHGTFHSGRGSRQEHVKGICNNDRCEERERETWPWRVADVRWADSVLCRAMFPESSATSHATDSILAQRCLS